MVQLKDLPIEILLHVLDHVKHVNIVAFALTCKRFYGLAEKELTVHGERKRKYTNVAFEVGVDRFDLYALLFRDIPIDPDIAVSITTLSMKEPLQRPTPGPEQPSRTPKVEKFLSTHRALVKEAFHYRTYLSSEDKQFLVQNLSSKMEHAWEMPTLLITLLPSLKSIANLTITAPTKLFVAPWIQTNRAKGPLSAPPR